MIFADEHKLYLCMERVGRAIHWEEWKVFQWKGSFLINALNSICLAHSISVKTRRGQCITTICITFTINWKCDLIGKCSVESGRGGVGGRRPRDLIWGENGLFLHKFFTLEREWFVAAQLFALEREWFVSAQTFHHSPISQNATISAFSTAQEYRTQHEFYKSQGLIFSHKMLKNFQKQDNNCQGKYFETTDWIQYVVDCLLSMPQGLEFRPPYFHGRLTIEFFHLRAHTGLASEQSPSKSGGGEARRHKSVRLGWGTLGQAGWVVRWGGGQVCEESGLSHPAIWAIGHRQAIRERSGQLLGGRASCAGGTRKANGRNVSSAHWAHTRYGFIARTFKVQAFRI